MEKSDDGWDLFAVVRSCRTERLSPAKVAPANSYEEVEKLCNPFFREAPQPKQPPLPSSSSSSSSLAVAPRRPLSQTIYRSKKKRNQQKRVICEVPADGLSGDMWAWRKYGQKPIKGSPYPRGYYRCSSSKGCLARKQVEKSRTDPAIFIITYSGEHNHSLPSHRNSLAGCTRQKFPPPAAAGEQGSRPDGSPITPLKREESEEDDDDEEGILLVEDMEVVGEDEVFFMGMQTTAVDGENCCFDESLFLPPFVVGGDE